MILFVSLGYSQDFGLNDLKKYYKNQKVKKSLTVYHDSLSGIQQIVLIRHGEPNIEKKDWRNRKEAIRFIQQYDSALVIPFNNGPLNLENIPIDTILHSSLTRARHTAQLAFGKSFTLIEDSSYKEFENKIRNGCNFKRPIRCWVTSSRIFWFLGLNDKNIESFKDAKKRAKSNKVKLDLKANQNGMVILVAHGLHNKYVKKFLRKAGWKLVLNNGNDYLSIKILALKSLNVPNNSSQPL